MNQVEALNVLIGAVQVAYSKAPGVFSMQEVRAIQNAIDTFVVPQQPQTQQQPELTPQPTESSPTPFVSQDNTLQRRNEGE